MLSLQKSSKDRTLIESMTNGQESVESATEKLEMFKLQLKRQKNACLTETGTTEGPFNTSTPEKHNRWSVAKSWTPCPIGTVPCSFSSTTIPPSFGVTDHGSQYDMVEDHENLEDDYPERFDPQSEELGDERMLEVSTPPREHEIPDVPGLASPLKGQLLVGGGWKQMTEEELQLMKSEMKILL